MTHELTPLRIFVAMPGTTMGTNAPWDNPKEVKQEFFGGIQIAASNALNRPVDLIIEQDKDRSGDILRSMYRECWIADIYIADLTGSNPNVYFELGERWALRDSVTILVTQNGELEFNLGSARYIPYSRDRVQTAITSVVNAIVDGLRDRGIDSLVRQALPDVSIIARAEYDRLIAVEKQHVSLIRQLAENYVEMGRLAQNSADRVAYFQKAVETDPLCEAAYVEWATEARNVGNNDTAVEVSQRGIARLPNTASLYGQLGLAYGKIPRIDEAISSLSTAVELAPNDAELLSNLGGALRRKAFVEPGRINVRFAQEARDRYQQALTLADSNLTPLTNDAIAYALGNVARLDFVLSNYDPDKRIIAVNELRRLRTICEEALRANAADYYRQFDLADSYLLAGDVEQGRVHYRAGIDSVPAEYRVGILASVATPLKQYMASGLGDRPMRAAMEEILRDLQEASKPSES